MTSTFIFNFYFLLYFSIMLGMSWLIFLYGELMNSISYFVLDGKKLLTYMNNILLMA